MEASSSNSSIHALDPLIEVLTDGSISVRWRAASALGRIGSKKAVDPLIEVLTDGSISVRWRAAKALGEIGSKKAVD